MRGRSARNMIKIAHVMQLGDRRQETVDKFAAARKALVKANEVSKIAGQGDEKAIAELKRILDDIERLANEAEQGLIAGLNVARDAVVLLVDRSSKVQWGSFHLGGRFDPLRLREVVKEIGGIKDQVRAASCEIGRLLTLQYWYEIQTRLLLPGVLLSRTEPWMIEESLKGQ
jgi:hypothetical protein